MTVLSVPTLQELCVVHMVPDLELFKNSGHGRLQSVKSLVRCDGWRRAAVAAVGKEFN